MNAVRMKSSARMLSDDTTTVDVLAAAGARPAMMSGSGSTVFGVFESPPDLAALSRSSEATPILTTTSARVVRVAIDV